MNSLDGNGLLKAYTFSMEEKMAAGAPQACWELRVRQPLKITVNHAY